MNRNVSWRRYTGQLAPIKSDSEILCAWCNEQALFVTKIDRTTVSVIAGQIQLQGTDIEASKETSWRIAEAAERDNRPPAVNRAHILNFSKEI